MNTDYFPTINLEKTGKNIERLRKARRLTVRELQSYFGFEQPQAIYKWQWGECLPSVDNLFALSKILHVPMQEILVENDQDFNFIAPRFCVSSPELHSEHNLRYVFLFLYQVHWDKSVFRIQLPHVFSLS